MLESTEQRACDQASAIRKNGWLLEPELEAIKRQLEDEFHNELSRQQDVAVDAETVEIDVGTAEEEVIDAEDSIGETEGDLSEEHQVIVEQLMKIKVERRTGEDIMFKKVDKKALNIQTDRVNEAINM